MTTNNASIEELVFRQGREISDHRAIIELLSVNVDEISNYMNQLENIREKHSRDATRVLKTVPDDDVSKELRDLSERITFLEARETQVRELHEMYRTSLDEVDRYYKSLEETDEYCKELSFKLDAILKQQQQSSPEKDTRHNRPFGVNICGWVAVSVIVAAFVLYHCVNIQR